MHHSAQTIRALLIRTASTGVRRLASVVLLLLAMVFASEVAAQTCDQMARFPRPIPLGISGGNNHSIAKVKGKRRCFGGTLGALVTDGSKDYILGSNRVFARGNESLAGAIIIQPSLADNACRPNPRNVVGKLSKRIKLLFDPHSENLEDAAIAQVKPEDVSPEILNIGVIGSAVATPQLQMTVQKMGEATCLTFGTITAVKVNVAINYGRGKLPRLANFTNQVAITSLSANPFGAAGDSGALILTTDTCPEPVALLLGSGLSGSGASVVFASPIQPVLNALNVTFVGGCTAGLGSSLGSEFTEGENLSIGQKVSAAAKVRDAHIEDLMKIPGAFGTGIGIDSVTGTAEIQVYVKDLTAAAEGQKDSSIDSVPVVINETGEIQPY